jgi:phage baseplate assembly protein gpV
MIGDKFGTWTLPEKEDVVAVVFLAGDINHPIVIGGVWSSKDTPPEVNEDGKNDFRLIKSRSGHRVLIDDTAKTKVVLTDKDNANYVGIGNFPEGGGSDNKMELATPSAINGSPTSGVAVNSSQGTVNIWCPKGTLKITAMNIEITASTTADIKAGGDMTHESSTKASFSGNAGVKMVGSKTNIGP